MLMGEAHREVREGAWREKAIELVKEKRGGKKAVNAEPRMLGEWFWELEETYVKGAKVEARGSG